MFENTLSSIIDTIKCLRNWWNRYDFTWQKFLEPCSYALISSYCGKNEIPLDEIMFHDNVKPFLKNIGFFWGECSIKAENVFPMKSVCNREDVDSVTTHLMQIFHSFVHLKNKDFLEPKIADLISEGLNNVADHSWDFTNNCISWQFFHKRNCLQIAIVDSGVWIFSHLRKIYSIENSEEAIKLALMPEISGWKRPDMTSRSFTWTYNAWMGLHKIQEILKQVKWDLFLGTKESLYCYNWIDDKESYISISDSKWIGTFLVFNIYSDRDIQKNWVLSTWINDILFLN